MRANRARVLALGIALALGVPALALAQSAPGPWRYEASLYLYLPSVGGSTSVPADSDGTPINVSFDNVLDSVKSLFMGSFEAHNGRWGVFTDYVYIDLGTTRQNSRDFTIGDIGLPAGTAAELGWDLTGWAWTTAGEYRVAAQPAALTLDVLGGVRVFDLRQRLRWNIAGDLGTIATGGRSGSNESSERLWDGIVGVKGRFALGTDGRWSLPLYADIGGGQSRLTWQLATGIAYSASWGDLKLLWRYLGYELKPGQTVESINFNGPQFGATFRW